jgi:hypothetical protein
MLTEIPTFQVYYFIQAPYLVDTSLFGWTMKLDAEV